MQLGMIGLGRMGGNIVRRLLRDGHTAVVFDQNPAALAALVEAGAVGASSLEDLVSKLEVPRTAWVMLPAGAITEEAVKTLGGLMQSGDCIIDGGNSFYGDDVRRGLELKEKGLHYVDVGTSGGVWGLERGYCMMIGGDTETVDRLDPIFKTLAPGIGEPLAWDDLPAALAGAGLLVNTTALGMKGQPPLVLDLAPMPADAAVADIVYAPLETDLLAAARRRGLAAVDGLGMLLHQAVPGFARWFGVTPQVTTALRDAIEASLRG